MRAGELGKSSKLGAPLQALSLCLGSELVLCFYATFSGSFFMVIFFIWYLCELVLNLFLVYGIITTNQPCP